MMGRGRLEIKRIENPTQRQSTFYKRRDGLFKKARELAVLCDSDLLLLLYSPSGKLYHYHSPSVPNVQELIRRYEAATRSRICTDQREEESRENVEEVEKQSFSTSSTFSRSRICTDQREEESRENVEEVEKLCELLERELRFLKIEEGENYSLPDLHLLEKNLEVAINKVRVEKDRKIHAEMETLHRMVKDRQQEGYGLCGKLPGQPPLGDYGVGEQPLFGYELDLKLGFD